jgi:hypothetical protein
MLFPSLLPLYSEWIRENRYGDDAFKRSDKNEDAHKQIPSRDKRMSSYVETRFIKAKYASKRGETQRKQTHAELEARGGGGGHL